MELNKTEYLNLTANLPKSNGALRIAEREEDTGLSDQTIVPAENLFDRAESPLSSLSRILDTTHERLLEGRGHYQIMSDLWFDLGELYWKHRDSKEIATAKHLANNHPLKDLVHECPFTRHAYVKPRGYAGDASLLDYIYQHTAAKPAFEFTSNTGREMSVHNVDVPAAAAVRTRRNILAASIADTVRRKPGARIMSVACGHLREIELLSPETIRSLGEFVAVDQDPKSLAVVAGYQPSIPTLAVRQASIIELMKDHDLKGFDFIYAAGLYDYLSDKLARKLTENLFRRLNTGGRLLVANFLPGIRDAGFMEFFMDWNLIYRAPDDIMRFGERIDDTEAKRSFFIEPNRNVGYLELTRR